MFVYKTNCTVVYNYSSLFISINKTINALMAPIHKQGRYTLEERSFIVRSFEEFKTLNDRAQRVVYAFQRAFPGSKVPSKSTVYRICEKFKQKFIQFRTSTRDKVVEKGLFLQKQPRPEQKLCLNKTETLCIKFKQALLDKIIRTCLNLLGVG